MPILLQCDELRPGMRLYEAIVRRGRTLLSGGKVLTHADVDILGSKYPEIRVRVGDPILDNVIEFEDDSHDRAVAQTATKKIANAMSKVNERFSSRASIGSMDVKAMQQSVVDVLAYLKANPVSAALLSRTLDAGHYLTEHAGNVFYLSMILGSAVRDYVDAERRRGTSSRWLDSRISMDLMPLGLGAMLADLGMLPFQYLYTSKEPLTKEESDAIREHPVSGADMLPADTPPAARSIVRSHHENFDGTGYPTELSGDRIHIFSRIVRIADAYDAATASHVYKEAKSPARALWEMTAGPYNRFYDPVLAKVFVRLIQPFPIGAKLRLRDGRFAVVTHYNREDPFKPTVVIAFDVNDNPLPKDQLVGPLSLVERPDQRIESFGDEQLSYLYGTGLADDIAPVRRNFSSLFESVFP